MKNYLRTQITLYEEDKNYPIWRRQERRSKYAVQLASWQLRSNSLKTSVCLFRPSHLFHYVSIIVSSWNFITIDRSDVHAKVKVRGQSSRSQVNTKCSGEESPYCFSRSSVKFQGLTGRKITDFDQNWALLDCNSRVNSQMATKCCAKLEVA